ncbi:hypothetical protein JCM10213v2_001879 [Rhodosporidiobolus nylandii]
MVSKTVVTILRHGETDHNRAGHLDIPLNAAGEAQALVAGRWLAQQGTVFDEAWSSDLGRARRTAEIVLGQQKGGGVQLKEDARIRERGKRRGDPGTDPSTVEPIPVLRSRLFSFWSSLFPSHSPARTTASDRPRQILYVSHGAAIREFIRAVLEEKVDDGVEGWSMRLPGEEEAALRSGSKRIDNCSRTMIEVEEVEDGKGSTVYRSTLLLYADDSHFAESSRAPTPTANADVVE